ncbi:distal membrane-arm assembly complex protein 2 isoform X1 [Paroedura picta]|uniref:distal membrane-arm assembly complex protein 2 isoform X1 n=1 Tax=Paroedura picta TaxID=143630 RepID=UPI00101589A0
MAAPRALQRGRTLLALQNTGPRHSSHSASPGLPKGWILQFLYNRFYNMETFIGFGTKQTRWNLDSQKRSYLQIQKRYGDDLAAAAFALMLKGGVRFRGQTEWYREHNQRQYSVNLGNYRRVPLEGIDFSGSVISYDGLSCLVKLKSLKHLDLSQCPSVDDWSLSLLHVFRDTLEELSLAGCPRVTERGLGCLHHLESLRRLDVSDLPSVRNKSLVQILLEEMLPQCEVVGTCYDNELSLSTEPNALQGPVQEPRGAACIQKTSEVPA